MNTSFFSNKLNEFFRIDNVVAHTDLNKVDKSKDSADTAKQRHNDFEYALLCFAKHKVVNTKTTEEKTNNNHNDFIVVTELAV